MKTIVCYDAPDKRSTFYLRLKADGNYVLETEKLLGKVDGKWVECPMDGSQRDKPVRWSRSRRQITEAEAIDWYVEKLIPEPLDKAIRELIGEVVSVDLGDLLKPLDRYCKAHGVSRQSVMNSALMEDLMRPRKITEAEAAIVHLQKLLARRFGTEFNTDAGEGTVFISHDAASMSDTRCSIVAQGADAIARALADTPRGAIQRARAAAERK